MGMTQAINNEAGADQYFAMYDDGEVHAALAGLQALPSSVAARALLALSENRPELVLAEPFEQFARNERALRYRAIAAWRVGDPHRLGEAVEGLPARI
jgi:hypothetical protein